MRLSSEDVLIIVDVQNDFCPGGALPVPGGDEILEVIHRFASRFEHIVLTQDWHPPGHHSFAGAHPGRKHFERIELAHGPQTLWPDHCIRGTWGAELHSGLRLPQAELILRKGTRTHMDSYSAFFENDQTTPTGLAGYLQERGLMRPFLAGLAYDYCVGYSALDAKRLAFRPVVVRDACRAIDLGGSVERMEARFREDGVTLIDSSSFAV